MYQDRHQNDNTENLKSPALYFKILIAICIFALGTYVVLWSIDIIDQLIHNTENISLIKTTLNLESDHIPFQVTLNNNRLVVENTETFKFIFLLLILIILFNIIGKAISGIFKCLASIIVSMNLDPRQTFKKQDTNT